MNKIYCDLTIIVFAKNEVHSFRNTLNEIFLHRKNCNLDFSVIAIDDNSTDDTLNMLKNYNEKNYNYFKIKSSGISEIVLFALTKTNSNFIMALPGHHMFEFTNVLKLIKFIEPNTIVIGYRKNLFEERPFGKFLAAKILKYIYWLRTGHLLKDSHGLVIFPRQILTKTLEKSFKHENLIKPQYYGYINNYHFKQIPIDLRVGHKNEGKSLRRRNVPKIELCNRYYKSPLECKETLINKLNNHHQ